jgi:hypothetical protein
MYTTTLTDPQVARAMLDKLWPWLRVRLQAGKRITISVGEEQRNLNQNSKLHALLGEIADQKEWAGQKWDAHDWKRLLTASWMRAKGNSASVIPAIDGQGFDVLYRHTSALSKAEMSDLIEYIIAWCALNGVKNEIKDT